MRRRNVVIGLGLALVALSGCYSYGYHGRYYGRQHYGYYGGGYTYTAAPAYNGAVYAPPPQQQQVVVEGQVAQPGQPVQVAAPPPQGVSVQPQGISVPGEGIAGSDGTRGWRVSVQSPQQEFQRLAQVAARASCQVEASTQTELRAVCNGNVHVVVRFDQQNVYKLCAPNTDLNVCAQVWSSLGS
jgi:hypothetical protein